MAIYNHKRFIDVTLYFRFPITTFYVYFLIFFSTMAYKMKKLDYVLFFIC